MKNLILVALLFCSLACVAQNVVSAPCPAGVAVAPGLTADPTGHLCGSPTQAGTFPLTAKVCDSETPPQCDTKIIPLTIAFSPVQITTTSLPVGVVGSPYPTVPLQAVGGNGNFTWIFISSPASSTN